MVVTQGITVEQFNALKKGDKINYCFEGGFTVTGVHKNADGSVDHIHVHHNSADRKGLTLGSDDMELIDLVA